MKRKSPVRFYVLLFVTLWLLLSAPKGMTRGMRTFTVSLFSPLWSTLAEDPADAYLQSLELENNRLMHEVAQLKQLLESTHHKNIPLTAVPSRVIYRSPSLWNSSLWIDSGRQDITQNSPVVVGDSVIGVVDYVGKHQSRVRLITDSGLVPSVRVFREEENPSHLAKGELYGSSYPLWRSLSHVLKGVGFNYDFADDYGPARDLRSGLPAGAADGKKIPLIQVNDLLVTTGMDGIFPEGLRVATVSQVQPLQEGDYTYTITALPTAGNLDTLSFVCVIPPQGFDPTDQP